jgi:hypothetical protein
MNEQPRFFMGDGSNLYGYYRSDVLLCAMSEFKNQHGYYPDVFLTDKNYYGATTYHRITRDSVKAIYDKECPQQKAV